MSIRFGLAVVHAEDIEKTKRFYVESFGLAVEREAPTFVQFEHFAISSDTPIAADGGTELWWLVDDVDAAYREMSAKGAVCHPLETKPFGKLFGVKDPDGRTRFVLQLAAKRPSQAVE